jgi:hypothetical protein
MDAAIFLRVMQHAAELTPMWEQSKQFADNVFVQDHKTVLKFTGVFGIALVVAPLLLLRSSMVEFVSALQFSALLGMGLCWLYVYVYKHLMLQHAALLVVERWKYLEALVRDVGVGFARGFAERVAAPPQPDGMTTALCTAARAIDAVATFPVKAGTEHVDAVSREVLEEEAYVLDNTIQEPVNWSTLRMLYWTRGSTRNPFTNTELERVRKVRVVTASSEEYDRLAADYRQAMAPPVAAVAPAAPAAAAPAANDFLAMLNAAAQQVR